MVAGEEARQEVLEEEHLAGGAWMKVELGVRRVFRASRSGGRLLQARRSRVMGFTLEHPK